MIQFERDEYFDDRLFVLEVLKTRSVAEINSRWTEVIKWALVTRRNVSGYPVRRFDEFDNRREAINYLRKVEPETPRISLGGQAPDPLPTYAEYRRWIMRERLRPSFVQGVSGGEPFFAGELVD